MSDNTNLYSRAGAACSMGQEKYQPLGSFYVIANDSYLQFLGKGKGRETTGWKFHLSVSPKDTPRATEIIASVYEEYGGAIFKVTKPEVTVRDGDPSAPPEHRGKIFTLYDMGEENWPQILQEIENRFESAGIVEGPHVENERHVTGSRYISYRNDDNRRGGLAVSGRDLLALPVEKRYNPRGWPDPYANIAIGASASPSQERLALAPKTPQKGASTSERDLCALAEQLNEATKPLRAGLLDPDDQQALTWTYHNGENSGVGQPHIRTNVSSDVITAQYMGQVHKFLNSHGLNIQDALKRGRGVFLFIKDDGIANDHAGVRLQLAQDHVDHIHRTLAHNLGGIISRRPDIVNALDLLNAHMSLPGRQWEYKPSYDEPLQTAALILPTGQRDESAGKEIIHRLKELGFNPQLRHDAQKNVVVALPGLDIYERMRYASFPASADAGAPLTLEIRPQKKGGGWGNLFKPKPR